MASGNEYAPSGLAGREETTLRVVREAKHEDLLTVISSVPERVGDLLSGIDQPGLQYRHGPPSPPLGELVPPLPASSTAIDSMLRQFPPDAEAKMAVRSAIDPPMTGAAEQACSELLADYARIRRRTMDLLR